MLRLKTCSLVTLFTTTKSELGGCFDPDAKDVFAVNSQALLLWPLRREGANGLPSLLTTVVLAVSYAKIWANKLK